MSDPKIVLILGCMFAGKTETLISQARKLKVAKKTIVLVKYSRDTRYSKEDICSHNQNTFQATFSCDNLTSLLDESRIRECAAILIDEGQFFSDLAAVVLKWGKEGKTVIISALSGDYRLKPWAPISEVLPIVTELVHLSAICSKCGKDAHYTSKKVKKEGDAVEEIGGEDKYEARCLTCFE
jgi:thymidine kinase